MFRFDFSNKETMEMVGKQVIVKCTDGDEISGKVVGFNSDKDNDSGVASIDIVSEKYDACVEILENEISSIEVK